MIVTKKYNPLSWFLFVYFINTLIGGIIFWIAAPHEGAYSMISGAQYWAVTLLSFVAISPFFLFRKAYSLRLDDDLHSVHLHYRKWRIFIIIFVGLYLGITFGNDILGMGYLELADARLDGDKLVEKWGFKYQLFHGVATYTYIELIIARLNSKDKFLTVFVLGFMIMFLILGTISLHKQDLIIPILLPSVIGASFSIHRGSNINITKLIVSSIVLLIVYFLTTGKSSFYFLLSEAASRIVTGQVGPLFLWYDYFSTNEFLYGASLPNPGSVFPYESVNVAADLMEHYFSIKGSIPVAFWGYIFADFGYVGVLLLPIFMLVYVFLILIMARKLLSRLELVSFYVYFGYKLVFLAFGSYALLFYDFTLPFILLFLFIIKALKYVWYSRDNIY